MKKNTALTLVAAVALGCLPLLTACPPPPPGRVYVRIPPPVPVVEVEGVAPGAEFIWIRGYHRWEGDRYVWFPGRWERRPRAGAVWVEGHWAEHRRGWYWVEGHWR
jgi:hypothetical protein